MGAVTLSPITMKHNCNPRPNPREYEKIEGMNDFTFN